MDVAIDVVALAIGAGQLQTLLIRRRREPFQGQLALPGGMVRDGEDPIDAVRRELREETGLRPGGHLESLSVYGAPGRDSRGHIISVAYLVLLPDMPAPQAGSDAADAYWQPVSATPSLAFDHDEILRDGLATIRSKIEYTTVATALCSPEFTLPELRAVYEAVWGTRLDLRNFYRKVLHTPGFIHPTGKRRSDGGRPASLYTRGDAHILRPPLQRHIPTPRPPPGPPAPAREALHENHSSCDNTEFSTPPSADLPGRQGANR